MQSHWIGGHVGVHGDYNTWLRTADPSAERLLTREAGTAAACSAEPAQRVDAQRYLPRHLGALASPVAVRFGKARTLVGGLVVAAICFIQFGLATEGWMM